METILNILKNTLSFIGFLIKTVILIVFKIIYWRTDKLKPLPPVKSDLLLLPAHELAKKIRQRVVTSSEVVELYIERIKEIQPLLNCVVATCYDEAIEEAKNVDKILASKVIPDKYNEENAPLLGVPFSCKETMWVKGMPNTAGLVRRKNVCAPEDSEVVKNMRNAGAILLCLTNISELCVWMESRNNLYGITSNAYNLSRSAGGSSGGEASLIAGAGSIIGIGSDIGGSIRIPCNLNGIYGHKCSNGLISLKGKHPPTVGEIKEKLNTVGPMCRYASDLRLLTKIQAGPTLFAKVADKFDDYVDLSQLNYYYIDSIYDPKVSSITTASLEGLYKAVNFIEKNLNVKVKRLDLKDTKYCSSMWSVMMRNGNKTSTSLGELVMDSSTEPFQPFNELMKSIARKSDVTFYTILNTIFQRIPISNPERLVQMATDLKNQVESIMGENGVLLSPGYPSVAPYHHQQMFTPFDFSYHGLYNVLGLPCTQCPMGLCSDSGLPVGIQIVASDKCDHLTIRLAEYFEQHLGGWKPPF